MRRPAARPLRPTAALAVILVTLAFPGARPAPAQPAAGAFSPPMADRLPATTSLYLGWSPDLALLATKPARMLADERFLRPWRGIFQQFVLAMPDDVGGAKISGHLPQLLEDVTACEGCFALLETKPDKRGLNPQAVFVLKLGGRRANFEAHFKPIHDRMKERLGEKLKMMKIEGSWLWNRTEHDRTVYSWGFYADSFVFFIGDKGDEMIPALFKGPAEAPLTASPKFQDCMSKIPGPSLFTTWMDTGASLGMLKSVIDRAADEDAKLLSGNWAKVLSEAGLDNVKSLGEKTVIENGQFITRTLARTDGAPHGLLATFVRGPVDDAMLKCVPADAMVAASLRFDAARTYEGFKSAAVAVGGNDAKESFEQFEQSAKDRGLPVDDALAPLGEQWVLYNATSTGGYAFTGWTLVTDVKDAEKLRRTTASAEKLILKLMGGEDADAAKASRKYEIDGVTVHYLQYGSWFSIVTPAWATTGDRFVFALYPQVVEDALRQLKAGASILDNPEFQACRKRTGNDGPALYISGPELTRNLYPTALLWASLLHGFVDAFDDGGGKSNSFAELLPSMQRMLSYVGSDGASIKSTPDGLLRTKTVANPLLSPLTLTDSLALWVALGLPDVTNEQEKANREKSAGNLREIGRALGNYAKDNNGNYPPDLPTLGKAQDLQAETFKSPMGDAKEGADYVFLYFKGMNQGLAAETVVAYDAAELQDGDGANVLFGDGHVDWLEREAFNAAMEKSKKARADKKPE